MTYHDPVPEWARDDPILGEIWQEKVAIALGFELSAVKADAARKHAKENPPTTLPDGEE
jgi:hypothetical protein